ncbi:MAG: endonuclease/exonuclease/phosphatase family protein [Flavobacteriales bacterium]
MNRPRTGAGPIPAEDKAPTPRRQRISRWHWPLWWANFFAAAVLLITYLAPIVSPVTFFPLALLAMTFTFQLLLHSFFLLWWFFFRKKRMLLSGLVLLLGWSHIGDHVQVFWRSSPDGEMTSTPVKLMSFNVRLFDLYNWTKNKETRAAIFDMLHEEAPEILCLQEFFHSPDKRFIRTRETLIKDFPYKAWHERYSQHARFEQHFGIATFSTRPIVAKGHIEFPENPNNQCIWSDIALENDTIRVYNAHLASYHFGDEDYKFIKELDTDVPAEELKTGGLRILKRLRRGFRLRADEVQRIVDHMRESPHPVVYCGDMNDVPMSYGYHLLRETLDDAFVESGHGLGGTYIGNLPSLRIDHILYGSELDAWDFHTLPQELSDDAITTMIRVRAQ